MNKYNNPRLLNAVVSGTGMKHPIQPHVVVGDVSNGFIRGDLMDANAIVDLVNSGDAIDQETIRQAVADVIGTAPENLDTLGEIVEALDAAVLDPNTEGSLAYKITALENELDEENADSFASKINSTIEDNELTIAAALNDLNSRLLELVTRVDALDGGGDTPEETQGYYAVNFGYNVIGYLKNNIYEISKYADGYSYATDLNGVIISQKIGDPNDPSYNDFIQAIKDKFLQNNIVVNEIIGKVESYTVGETVPNWNEYTVI